MIHARLLWLFLALCAACGQDDSQSAAGVITDSSGTPVAGAWVVVEFWWSCCDGPKRQVREKCTQTDAAGTYSLSARLRPGWVSTWSSDYRSGASLESVAHAGFKRLSGPPVGTAALYRCNEPQGSGPCVDAVSDSEMAWCQGEGRITEH